jgi:hypothetical protein
VRTSVVDGGIKADESSEKNAKYGKAALFESTDQIFTQSQIIN